MDFHADLTITFAVIFSAIAMSWVFMSPSVSRVIIKLLCRDDARFVDAILTALSDKRHRPRLKGLIDDMYADRIRQVDEGIEMALSIAQANTDRLEQVVESIKGHGAELKEVKALTRDVPSITPAINRLTQTLDKMSDEFAELGKTVARIDERQLLWERRQGQAADTGQRRRETDR